MPTQFVLGRAASGKTQHCIDRIIATAKAEPLGPPIYFIVPKQATFVVQRRLAVGGGLPGFCRIRVTSFDRLTEDILTEYGGDAAPLISPRGRRLILMHILRQLSNQLRIYGQAAGRVGLAAEIDRTLGELDRNSVDEHQLQTLIERLAGDDPATDSPQYQLILKLRDLLLIQNAYTTFLGQERIDPQRRLAQVAAAVEQSRALSRSSVFVDGHLDVSTIECRLLASLALRVENVTVTALTDPQSPVARDVNNLPDDLSLFHRTESAYRRMHFCFKEAGVDIAPPLLLVPTPTRRPDALNKVEAHWYAERQQPRIADGSPIRMLAAPSRRSEVATAAVVVRQWLQEGMRPREVLVLTRTAADYADLIEATFSEYGIPYFSDRRRSATHHPLLQVVRAIVQAWRERFPHQAMMTLAKSALCGISPSAADRVENFILEHNLTGPAWMTSSPWAFKPRPDDEEHAGTRTAAEQNFEAVRQQLAGPIRAMISSCPPTGTKLPIRQYVGALLEALSAYKAPASLASWIEAAEEAQAFEQAAEHQQVWAEFVELLDELVDLLGDDALSPVELQELLESSLSEFDLAIAPAGIDQVMVGEVERTRFEHFRGVVALGWNDGEFPRTAGEATVLGDADRASISKARVELDPDTNRNLLNEPLLAYVAITRATERFAVIFHEADDAGRPAAGSSFSQHLAWLLDRRSDGDAAIERVDLSNSTPRAVVGCLAHWAREADFGPECNPADLYAAISTISPRPPPLQKLLTLAWPALSYQNTAALSPDIIAELYAGTLNTSVSRTESFAACPFKHFASHVLRLRTRIEPVVSAADLGTLYHRVLEVLVNQQVADRQKWDPAHRPPLDAIRKAIEHAGQSLRVSLMLSSAQNRQLLKRAEARVEEVLRRAHTAGAAGQMLPLAAEVVFGDRDATLPPLTIATARGRTVSLSGKIDRVDHATCENAVAVFDYKTTAHRLNLHEVYHGLSLQLLTYLLLLESQGTSLSGTPVQGVAAFYVAIMRALENVDHPENAAAAGSDEFALREVPRGLFDLSRISLLDTNLTAPGKSAIIALKLKKSGEPYTIGCDHAEHAQFRGILGFVREKIASLADQIIDGVIEVRPYRIGKVTPCANCEFRPVCRFDPALDRYLHLVRLSRNDAIAAMTGGAP